MYHVYIMCLWFYGIALLQSTVDFQTLQRHSRNNFFNLRQFWEKWATF